MPNVQLRVVTRAGTAVTPLEQGWAYRKDGTAITTLRAESDGRLRALRAGGDATKPWDYTEAFTVAEGATLQLCFSRGVSPIPSGELSSLASAFVSVTVPPPSAQPLQVGPGGPNTVMAQPTSTIELPDHVLRFTSPVEPSIFPVLFGLPSAAYATSGLSQGGALWTSTTGSGTLTVTPNSPAAAPPVNVRPTERAQRVTGVVDAAATGVRVAVVDAASQRVGLTDGSASATPLQEVTATLGPVSGNERTFEATFALVAPAAHFGSAQLLALSDGLPVATAEVAFVTLTGIQATITDDRLTNVNGTQAGPARGEADEVVIVDFTTSPQSSLQDISNQTRARRMLRFELQHRVRAGATAPVPEMPLLMGEVQFLGLSRAHLESLMQRRKRALAAAPTDLSLSFQWTILTEWDGPNSGSTTRPHRSQTTFNATVEARLTLDSSDGLSGVSADDGHVASAYDPAPAAVAFPVAGRRAPTVFVGVSRPWGRVAGATTAEATVLEFQPGFTNAAGEEIVRGGDGRLTVEDLTLAGEPVAVGFDVSGSGLVAAPTSPHLRLPRYRVTGVNPPRAQIEAFIDAEVTAFVAGHQTVAGINVLSVAEWQRTVRAIVEHESVNHSMNQFEHRDTGRRRFDGRTFGHETDMPIFGAPAGYGLAQLDNPAVTPEQVWSFAANIRGAVELLIQVKGAAAFGALGSHFSTPPTQRDKAVFQRDAVRRYNGGREMRFNTTSNTFEIFPQGTSQDRIEYPNQVLGTSLTYSGIGVAVAFTAANFGL